MDELVVRRSIKAALAGKSAHSCSENAFDGLDPALVGRIFGQSSHTLFQLLNHMTYWLRFCLKFVRGGRPIWPTHSEHSWPGDVRPVDNQEWESAVEGYKSALRDLILEADSCNLGAGTAKATYLEALQATAAHTSYHVGQVVLIRQVFHSWPPPGGGMTW